MTRNQYKKLIEEELKKINERIDFKIIHGMRYADESRQHKLLLKRIERQQKSTFTSRLYSVLKLQF